MKKPKFKVGDKVKVLRASTEAEYDLWRDSWMDEMNGVIGKEGTVEYCYTNKQWDGHPCCPKYTLRVGTLIGYNYPEFVLQSVVEIGEQLLFDFY